MSIGRARFSGRASSYVLVLPLALVLGLLLVWPLAILARRSIETDSGWSLALYAEVIANDRYQRSLAVTAGLAIASTVIALVICVPASIYLERTATRWSRMIATALTIPLSLPGIVIGFFVILIFGNTGVIPTISENATGTARLNIAYNLSGLLIGYLYFNIPRVVLVIRGALSLLDPETIDVGRTLGAGPFQLFRSVVLPPLRPGLANAASLSLATAFGAYGTAATLSLNYRVVPLDIAATFTESFQPDVAAALSVILVTITVGVLSGMRYLGERRQ